MWSIPTELNEIIQLYFTRVRRSLVFPSFTSIDCLSVRVGTAKSLVANTPTIYLSSIPLSYALSFVEISQVQVQTRQNTFTKSLSLLSREDAADLHMISLPEIRGNLTLNS
jgi:hypothetical protein